MLLILLSTALAGERFFAFSYNYGTVPKGAIEVEHYLTSYGKDGGEHAYTEQQVELEYGITDRLETGLYVRAMQYDEEYLAYKGWKARLRYRLGNEGVGLVDPELYLEYISSPLYDEHGVEAKVILGKSTDRVVGALNLEYVAEFGDGFVQELEPTLGVAWRARPWLAAGVEGKFEAYLKEDGVEGPYVFAGPAVHLAGEGGRFWITLAAILPVTPVTMEDEGPQLRSLVAVNL
jgi:hypothetical protein